MAEPVKPLTLEEISELRKKAQETAGSSSIIGPDYTNVALFIVAEKLAEAMEFANNFERIIE